MRINFGGVEGLVFEKNILMADEILFYPASPDTLAMPDNIIFSYSETIAFEEEVRAHPRKLIPFKPREGSVVADPKFTDWEKGDFSFQKDSPALKFGIESLDVSDVGINGLSGNFWGNRN